MRVGNVSTIIKSKRDDASDVVSRIVNGADKRRVKFAVMLRITQRPGHNAPIVYALTNNAAAPAGHDKGTARRSIKIIARRRARCVAVSIFASSRAANFEIW